MADAFIAVSFVEVEAPLPTLAITAPLVTDTDLMHGVALGRGARVLSVARHTDADAIYASAAQLTNLLRPGRYADADLLYATTLVADQVISPDIVVNVSVVPHPAAGRKRKRTHIQPVTGISRAGSAPSVSRQKTPALNF